MKNDSKCTLALTFYLFFNSAQRQYVYRLKNMILGQNFWPNSGKSPWRGKSRRGERH